MLGVGSLGRVHHTINIIAPTIGMNPRKNHHPDLPISCRRRHKRPSEGKRNAIEAMDDTTLARFSLIGMNTAEMAVPTIAVNNVNHQNSERDARPEKLQ
mgnify:FL=1|jgi:hypothetical protein